VTLAHQGDRTQAPAVSCRSPPEGHARRARVRREFGSPPSVTPQAVATPDWNSLGARSSRRGARHFYRRPFPPPPLSLHESRRSERTRVDASGVDVSKAVRMHGLDYNWRAVSHLSELVICACRFRAEVRRLHNDFYPGRPKCPSACVEPPVKAEAPRRGVERSESLDGRRAQDHAQLGRPSKNDD